MLFLASLLAGSDLNANLLGWLGGLVLVAGFGLGFSGLALALASRTDNPGAYHAMIVVFNLPMLFLSNALYPLDTMPSWMKIGTLINPTTNTVDGLRQMGNDTFGSTSERCMRLRSPADRVEYR